MKTHISKCRFCGQLIEVELKKIGRLGKHCLERTTSTQGIYMNGYWFCNSCYNIIVNPVQPKRYMRINYEKSTDRELMEYYETMIEEKIKNDDL